jgi:hypothetical protein
MPFLALGLAPAFARWRVATSVLAAISIGATTAVSITWAEIWTSYPWVWKDVPRAVTAAGRTNLVREIDTTWLGWLGVNRTVGAAFVLACGLLALALAVLGQTQEQR